jgi:hypothetical protein
VDVDILKPNTGYVSIERPLTSSKGTSEQATSSDSGTPADPAEPGVMYAEPLSEGEDDEDMDLAPAKDEDKRTGLTELQIADAVAYRVKMLQERQDGAEESNGEHHHAARKAAGKRALGDDVDVNFAERGEEHARPGKKSTSNRLATSNGTGKPKALAINPLAPSSAFDETLRDRLRGVSATTEGSVASTTAVGSDEGEDAIEPPLSFNRDDRVLVRSLRAPNGKRIAVPVRIEPKVYFAAERTFLVSPSLPLSCDKS